MIFFSGAAVHLSLTGRTNWASHARGTRITGRVWACGAATGRTATGAELLWLITILFSNWAGAEITETRLCSGDVSSQGSLGYLCCIIASFPFYCCAIEGLTSWSFLWPGETSDFLKHEPKSSHAPLSVVAFRLEFACGECTFFKAFLVCAI